MGHASCSLRFVGDALPLDEMGKMLDLANPRYRADMHAPPDYDGMARSMIWTAFWEKWDVPQPPIVRVGNPTSEAVGRLLDHVAEHRGALRSILRTSRARGEVMLCYTCVREVRVVFTPRVHALAGELGLDTRIWVTDDLG